MITADYDFDYGECSENPPRIIGFDEQEKEVRNLIDALRPKLDDEGKSLLRMLLKKWGPFYLNSLR